MAPLEGDTFCFVHSPARAHERAVARKKGGAGRRTPRGSQRERGAPVSLGTVPEVLAELELLYADTLCQENSGARSRTLGGLLGVALRVVEVGELEGRVAAIEARQNEPRRTA